MSTKPTPPKQTPVPPTPLQRGWARLIKNSVPASPALPGAPELAKLVKVIPKRTIKQNPAASAGSDPKPTAKAKAEHVVGTARRGWGWPQLSKKPHYFVDGQSLCGRWMFFGEVSDKDASEKGPDDCAQCRRRYGKEAK